MAPLYTQFPSTLTTGNNDIDSQAANFHQTRSSSLFLLKTSRLLSSHWVDCLMFVFWLEIWPNYSVEKRCWCFRCSLQAVLSNAYFPNSQEYELYQSKRGLYASCRTQSSPRLYFQFAQNKSQWRSETAIIFIQKIFASECPVHAGFEVCVSHHHVSLSARMLTFTSAVVFQLKPKVFVPWEPELVHRKYECKLTYFFSFSVVVVIVVVTTCWSSKEKDPQNNE